MHNFKSLKCWSPKKRLVLFFVIALLFTTLMEETAFAKYTGVAKTPKEIGPGFFALNSNGHIHGCG